MKFWVQHLGSILTCSTSVHGCDGTTASLIRPNKCIDRIIILPLQVFDILQAWTSLHAYVNCMFTLCASMVYYKP